MAGRCGCSSNNATGASIIGPGCIGVTGAGTPASPAVITATIDPDPANNLQCGGDGLFVATAQINDGDCIAVSGDGSFATPYVLDTIIDPDTENQVACGAAGLLVPHFANVKMNAVGSASFGGAPPDAATTDWIKKAGTYVGTSNVAGHIVVPFPGAAFPNGVLSIVYAIGDVPGVPTLHSIDQSTVALDRFDVVFQTTGGVPINAGNYRINYEVVGW